MSNILNWKFKTIIQLPPPTFILYNDATQIKFIQDSIIYNNVYCNAQFHLGNTYDWTFQVVDFLVNNSISIGIIEYNNILCRSKFAVELCRYNTHYTYLNKIYNFIKNNGVNNDKLAVECYHRKSYKPSIYVDRRSINNISKLSNEITLRLIYNTIENYIYLIINNELIGKYHVYNWFINKNPVLKPFISSIKSKSTFKIINTNSNICTLKAICRRKILVDNLKYNALPIELINYLSTEHFTY